MSALQNSELQRITQAMRGGDALFPQDLSLQIGEFSLRLRSNSAALIARLEKYFAHVVQPVAEPLVEVVAIDSDELTLPGVDFIHWRREAGKQGGKDSYCELSGARLLRKVRTGMLFLQNQSCCLARGPCLRNDNQVINFIVNQYINYLQQRNWLICHAAAVVRDGAALALAAFSGGGKSTQMLRLMDEPAFQFMSNDRVFIRSDARGVAACGVPKQPRINPGTIVHNPRLQGMLSPPRREALLRLPAEELWQLEEKYDVNIESVYGPGRNHVGSARLAALVILNWRRDSSEACRLQGVDPAERSELLEAVMKSSGPFYQQADGSFKGDSEALYASKYLDVLGQVAVYEVVGGVDFDALSQALISLLQVGSLNQNT